MAPLPPPRKRFYFCKKIQLGCAGLAWPYLFGNYKYISLWKKLDADPTDLEVRRNLAITQPLLWIATPDEIPLLKPGKQPAKRKSHSPPGAD